MNLVVAQNFVLSADYAPLVEDASLIGDVEITNPSGNGSVSLLGSDGEDVVWAAGEWHDFRRVRLATLQFKGTPGQKLTLIGNTSTDC
jgi:hypothetical protein